ncbi:nuclear transport factor 2 family protein [Microbacterium sp. Mu-80]|uniref:Nuclear transport factor 2 family protein n=1 Tax=Microbacterium bandirmense TaxID=3122050 RepID=A0ABU8LAW4_9MICO
MSAALERRLRALEDRIEIADLIARYGPAVDSGDGEAVAELWAEDGTYQFDETVLDADGIRGLTGLASHVEYMRRGCAHVLSAPRIEISDDEAVAITHSLVMLHDGERWIGERVSANRWELVRATEGWRVRRRINRLLDGAAAARELLSS